MFNKKAQGLSMNTIIIAAIALVVLVVLVVLVINATNDVNKGTTCESLGGSCKLNTGDGTNFQFCQSEGAAYSPESCASSNVPNGICCIPLG